MFLEGVKFFKVKLVLSLFTLGNPFTCDDFDSSTVCSFVVCIPLLVDFTLSTGFCDIGLLGFVVDYGSVLSGLYLTRKPFYSAHLTKGPFDGSLTPLSG